MQKMPTLLFPSFPFPRPIPSPSPILLRLPFLSLPPLISRRDLKTFLFQCCFRGAMRYINTLTYLLLTRTSLNGMRTKKFTLRTSLLVWWSVSMLLLCGFVVVCNKFSISLLLCVFFVGNLRLYIHGSFNCAHTGFWGIRYAVCTFRWL